MGVVPILKGKEMTRWGVGPKFTLISVIFGVTILTINLVFFPFFTFVLINRSVNVILGIALIVLGLPVFIIPALTIDRYIYEGKLCKTGVYSVLRHPIYGAWIVFIIPGIVLIAGCVLGILVPIFMYVLFKILIVEEERYLEDKFGEEFLEYRKRVGSVFPKLNFRKN